MDKKIGWLLQEKYPKLNPSDLNEAGGPPSLKLRRAKAKKDIARLKAGEPLDHIIGFVEFLGCKMLVGPDVLIPRVETEFWVEQVIQNSKFKIQNSKVLDMFAGSGCIGIVVLKRIKNTNVVFVDSQKEALKQIEKNCNINKIAQSRYEIFESDVFSGISGKFDYIFANPPYIPTTKKNKIQKSVLQHEPKPALFGGKDGLDLIRRFLAAAKNRLNGNGKIYMEFDTIQRNKINILLKKFGYKHWQFYKDQYDRFRWVVVNN